MLPDASQPLANQFSYDPRYPASRASSYDQYLYGRSLIRAAGEKPDWQQTMTGRIATRVVTRGIFGALAFTWAGNYASRSLRNYDPSSIRSFTEWRKALTNVHAESADPRLAYVAVPNTMQAIAKAFDVVAGKPIQAAARVMGGKDGQFWAEKAVHFRPRASYHDPISKMHLDDAWKPRHYGRSLGHEVVAITADFAAASAADAFTRNIVQAIDPNVEKDWYDKDGHFSIGKFGKDWARRTWQVVSFNQGEDWAVAVPYAFFMKWHRNVIEKFSPGFKFASDHSSWNAACDKAFATVENGKITNVNKVGDFQMEGAWDLQARFTVYNVLTLMYRETYKSVANHLGNWWKGPDWIPKVGIPSNPVASAVEGAGNAARYAAKSFIKANLYMQPAVPFFWSFRVAQSKWRGGPILINDKNNPNERLPEGSSRFLTTQPNVPGHIFQRNMGHAFTGDTVIDQGIRDKHLAGAMAGKNPASTRNIIHMSNEHLLNGSMQPKYSGPLYSGRNRIDEHSYHRHDPYAPQNAKSTFGALFGPLGRASNGAGNLLGDRILGMSEKGQDRAASILGVRTARREGMSEADHRLSVRNGIKDSARIFADASFAYTPYMIAKAETARRWDNKDMDKAIYSLMDGVVSFNLGQTKAALKDIGNILTNPPPTVEDPGFLQSKPESATPDTKVSHVARAALVHPEHRTLQ